MNFSFTSDELITLESGQLLQGFTIAYSTYGQLNRKKDNVVWVCHALTANAEVKDWWTGLIGEECLFNEQEHFIICANILGSCYGSTGPLSVNPETSRKYYTDFPLVTVRDMVHMHQALADHLGIEEIFLLTGGSLGGQQALEWAVTAPLKMKNLVVMATNARHSPWGIAFNEAQRMAIEADSSWHEARDTAGQAGLKAARAIALLSYRNYKTFTKTQTETDTDKVEGFKASSYQQYQGTKLINRFNAFSYYTLTKAMDSHNLGRRRGELTAVLGTIIAKTLVIGLSSDILFPVAEQEFLARYIPGAEFSVIDSLYGHDGFLIETPTLSRIIASFLSRISRAVNQEVH